MSTEQWLAPTVISSMIAGGVAVATHFSSQRAKRMETREDIRSQAFDQAKSYYTDVIERQEKELATMRIQIEEALRRITAAERNADEARASVRMLRADLADRDERIADLQSALARSARPPTARTRYTDPEYEGPEGA